MGWREEFTVSQADIDAFASLTGDDNPIHVDPAYAATTDFGGTIAHGGLIFALLRTGIARHHPAAVLTTTELSFQAPTYAGDRVVVTGEGSGAVVAVTVTGPNDRVLCEFSGEYQ